MAANGVLAGTVGALIGTGTGRGIALLFIVLGLVIVATVAIGSRYRPFWQLEQRLLAKMAKMKEEKDSRPVFV
jgi:MFS transporter, DHA3 family, macrolide efflux protein